MKPLISIIVPVYNVDQYLKQCIDSLISQTYKNIEIILVDDGSTDKSGYICDDYSNKHTNVISFHKKNSGLGLTRNFGLQKASGQYVMFVDSDDYVNKNMVSYLIKYLNKYSSTIKVDTVIGGFSKVSDDGAILFESQYQFENYLNENIKSKLLPRMLGSQPSKHDSIEPSVCNRLFSKEIIDKNSLTFVSERKLISEDIVWDVDYFKYSKHAVVTPSTLYYYRYNPNSLTTTYKKDRFKKCLYFYKYMISKTKKEKIYFLSKNRLKKQFFINLRECISQEKINNFCIARANIKSICSNLDVQQIINDYPINKLGFKQRFFIKMIKRKCSILLTVLSKNHVI